MSRGRIETGQDGHRIGTETGSESHPADELLVPADAATDPRLSIVMPTLNEEDGIATCIDRAKAAIHELGMPAEILISDDSTDRTPDIARERGAQVLEPDKGGYGYAYRYAFERARGEYIVMGDADCTYDFEAIPELLNPVADGSADIVLGSRLDGDIEPGAMPWLHQYIGNPLLTRFLNTFYDAEVTDAHSGFRAFTAEAIDELDLQTNGMEFASEMVMQAAVRDLTVSEVPITYHRRAGDATLESFRDGWRHVRFMLINAPGYLFSVPGLSMLGLGPLLMLLTLLGVSIGGFDPGIHSMVAGSLLTVVGYQVLSLGVFATIAGDPLQRPDDWVTNWINRYVSFEHGATAGVGLVVAGILYVAVMLFRWITSGFVELPLLMTDMIAFTAIVIGIQTLFGSFFMSVVGDTK